MGPARLPVLVRIGDYARARWRSENSEPELTLTDFAIAGRHHLASDLNKVGLTQHQVGLIVREAWKQGKVLLILDGLDEVGDPDFLATLGDAGGETGHGTGAQGRKIVRFPFPR